MPSRRFAAVVACFASATATARAAPSARPGASPAAADEASHDSAHVGADLGVHLGVHLDVHLGVHLSWVRDDASSDCPDAAAIEAEVSERLGGDPFQRRPTQFIEATVTRQADRFQVAIAMRGVDGKLIGNRSLTSTSNDCRSIATAAALTIAILIDPDALARPISPPPPAPPPQPAAPPAAPPNGPRGRVTAAATVSLGALPSVAVGAELAATIDVAKRASVGIVGAFLPERRSAAPNDDFAFGLSYGELLGCLVLAGSTTPTRPPPALRWELCAGLSAGLLHAVVYASNPLNPGQRWTFAAVQATRLVIALPGSGAGFVEVGLEASEPLGRRSFFVEGRPAGMDTVFTQPAVAAAASLGVGLRWR